MKIMKFTNHFYVIYEDLLSEDKFNKIKNALTNKGILPGYHITNFNYEGYKYFSPGSRNIYIRIEKNNAAYLDNNKQNHEIKLSIEEFEKFFLMLKDDINYEIY